ncbi:MAG: hypothetical protein Q9M13_08280 [Mariprofundales bacterium]|nr:hypothetical protein [Mariprofundales bacterium]
MKTYLLILLPIVMLGCNQESAQPIKWQLPLTTTSADPHKPSPNSSPPAWAVHRDGSIHLRLLATNSSKLYPVTIAMDGEVSIEELTIRLTGLATGLRIHSGGLLFDDPKIDNPAAFIEIERSHHQIFSGWIYRDFPELFTPDIPGWKFFLDDATIRGAVHSDRSAG